MKNQLVKESYAEKWEDIVRSGNTHSPPQGTESETCLPAEFGTKDKVPAEGMAPMGLSDYADGSQWTQRDGELERRENGQAPDSNSNSNLNSNSNSSSDSSGKTASAQDGGFVGGDGASLDGAARPNNSSASNQAPSNGVTSAENTHLSSTEVQGHLQNQPQGSGQLPSQAPVQSSSKQNGAAPPTDAGRLSSGSNGASSSGSDSIVAPSDSDWWREITEASKRSDCKDAASALKPKQDQPKPSRRQVDDSPAKAQAEQDIFGGKAHDPDSQSNSSRQNGASSSSSSKPASRSSSSSPHSASSSDSSSSKGLSVQTPQASANSSMAEPQSQQEAAEMKKKTQEVRELADKIEGQEAGTGQKVGSPDGVPPG